MDLTAEQRKRFYEREIAYYEDYKFTLLTFFENFKSEDLIFFDMPALKLIVSSMKHLNDTVTDAQRYQDRLELKIKNQFTD